MKHGLLSTESPAPIHRGTSLVPLCGACKLYLGCKSPKMPLWGEGKRKVLVIGEGPGAEEDSQNRPFVGKAGQRLRRELGLLGVNLDRDCWVSNSIICRPKDNATPTDAQIEYCRPNLLRIIQEKQPETIILLGAPAVRSIIGYLWRENSGGIERWQGWHIPCQKWNCWICPTFHPSYVEREKAPVLDLMFHDHLKRAFALKERPWKKVPDYLGKCHFVYDPQEAVNVIATMIFSVKPIAIALDYETSSLKPDDSDSKIICCSVSDGNESVAFLWKGVVIEAMKGFLSSNIPKIASNLKFESRWSLAKLGIEPKNWLWDTMLAAHILDNRPHISSIKFQAFALLGQPPWDEQVKPYMEPKGDDQKKFGDNARNQLHKVDPKTLGIYCAMDSLMEWHVAKAQRKQMGVKT